MPKIELTNVTKRWNKFYAVDNLSIVIEDNAFVTLLGPSGCGKTTILRMIAGLETPTSGRIVIGDQVMFDSELGINIPANKRKVGFLFQNYALWPNMTVYQNIAFGLSNIKDELPKVDFNAKNASRLAELLKKPAKVAEVLEECRDKNGELDNQKACIKLIDAFTLSMQTAKKLYGYHLEQARDMSSEIATLTAKVEAARRAHELSGESLNDKFEVVKAGAVVTEKRKLTKEEIDLTVRRVSRIVKIGMFMDRYPAELSGGQQQRVAIARTLAPEPGVLFMDEPLSNLDAKLRLEMRYELQRLHVETGSTFVYVTHDQMEAMTLATRICLVENGVLQQYAAPLEVYNTPTNTFVADFVGNPSINFVDTKAAQRGDGTLELTVLGGRKAVFTPEKPLDLAAWIAERDAAQAAQDEGNRRNLADKNYVEKQNRDERFQYHVAMVDEDDFSIADEPVLTNEDLVLGVRPEFVKLNTGGMVDGEIYGAMPTGMESTVKVNVGGYLLTSVVFGSELFTIGDKAHIDFSGNNILLFDRQSGKSITTGRIEFINNRT